MADGFGGPFEEAAAAIEALSRGEPPGRLGAGPGGFARQRAIDALGDFLRLGPEEIRAIVTRAGITGDRDPDSRTAS